MSLNPDYVIGYGYVGRWENLNHSLGWSMPEVVAGSCSSKMARRYQQRPPTVTDRPWAAGKPHYLCKITIELVRDTLGRPIVAYPEETK